MVPGIYKAEWSRNGQVLGGGLLVFIHNVIAGADYTECIFNGEYAFDSAGNIVVRWLKLNVPGGITMAQGLPPAPRPYVLDMPSITLDVNDDAPTVFEMPTMPLPLTVKMTRLRRLEP